MQFSGNIQILFVWRVISMHIVLRIGRTLVLTMHNLWIQGSMKIIMLGLHFVYKGNKLNSKNK